MKRRRLFTMLAVCLVLVNFVILFHATSTKTQAEEGTWVRDGLFSLSQPDGCYCPIQSYVCYCLRPVNP